MRDQILDHVDSRTFQYYIDPTIKMDIQGAFQGNPSTEMLRIATRKRLLRDLRAPRELDETCRREVVSDPVLQELRAARDSARQECRRLYGKANKALGTEMGNEYLKLRRQCSARYYSALARTRKANLEKWFQHRDTHEIEMQLCQSDSTFTEGGRAPKDTAPLVPPLHAEDFAPERSKICEMLRHTPVQDQTVVSLEWLTKYCARKEPQKRPTLRLGAVDAEPAEQPQPEHEASCDRLQCIICFYDTSRCDIERNQSFTRTSSLWDHIDAHLLKAAWPMICPIPRCGKTCGTMRRFKHHVHKVHDVVLRPSGKAL